MDRLVRDDRKETVTQITTRYNQGMQNTISEHTTHRTLKGSTSHLWLPKSVLVVFGQSQCSGSVGQFEGGAL